MTATRSPHFVGQSCSASNAVRELTARRTINARANRAGPAQLASGLIPQRLHSRALRRTSVRLHGSRSDHGRQRNPAATLVSTKGVGLDARLSAGALRAGAVENHLVFGDVQRYALCDLADGSFESVVGEWCELAAVVADHVVVVAAALALGFEADDALAHFELCEQTEIYELVKDAVDAGA